MQKIPKHKSKVYVSAAKCECPLNVTLIKLKHN